MKRLSTIIMALVLVLGMAQCKKQKTNESNDGSYTGVTKNVTFTTGSGSKVVVDNSILDELHFKWEEDDKLYVYGSENGTFSDGQYCGSLDIAEGVNTENGFFVGTLDNVPTRGKLRFYYCAEGLFNDTDKTIAVDLSSQDGTLAGLATKVVACAELEVKSEGAYSAVLEVPYSVVKFNLSAFGTASLTMTGITNKGVAYTAKGVKGVTAGTSTTLSGVTSGSTSYFVAVMPENLSKLNFAGGGKVGSKAVALEENKFYTAVGGTGVVVEAKTPAANPTDVTTAAGCSGYIYTMGGTVTLTEEQQVEYGFVYSETATESVPEIGKDGCTKLVGNTENLPVGTKSFTIDLTGLTVGTQYSVRAYAIGESGTAVYAPNNSAGIKTIVGGDTPQDVNWNGGGTQGASPYLFTVYDPTPSSPNSGDETKVRFSQGNLQYIGSAATPYWKFADHQFDFLGATTGQGSATETIDRDLFAWGTSGQNHGAVCYQPWCQSGIWNQYHAYGDENKNLYDSPGTADWGYNTIHAGSAATTGWRTLRAEEWAYLFNTRADASSKWGHGKVGNCIPGLIILPDVWECPSGLTFTPGNSDWSNVYSFLDWSKMETAGAVFLPAAGFKSSGLVNMGKIGVYHSSSCDGLFLTNSIEFRTGELKAPYSCGKEAIHSVRLVR